MVPGALTVGMRLIWSIGSLVMVLGTSLKLGQDGAAGIWSLGGFFIVSSVDW